MNKLISKILFVAAGVFILTTTSCKKIVSNQTFTHEHGDIHFIVPPTDEVGEITLFTMQEKIKTDSVLAANGFEGMTLSSARFELVLFEIDGPDHANFDIMDNASAYASSPAHPEVLVAHRDHIPKEQLRAIEVFTEDVELAPMLNDAHFNLTSRGVLSQPVTDTVYMRATLRYHLNFEE